VAGTAARLPSISHSKQFSPRQPNCSLVVEKFGLTSSPKEILALCQS